MIFAPGRADLVQDVDAILSNFHSMSFCTPHLFGDRLEEFDQAVRSMLAARSETGGSGTGPATPRS